MIRYDPYSSIARYILLSDEDNSLDISGVDIRRISLTLCDVNDTKWKVYNINKREITYTSHLSISDTHNYI